MDLFEIILIVLFLIGGYFVGKYLTEQKKWGTKKAELERNWESKVSDIEKRMLERERQFSEYLKKIELDNKGMINEMENRYVELIKGFRKDAVTRSRNTIMGKLWEQVAPYLPKFNYHPSDMKFIGSPIDYIVFEGMNEKDIRKVVFVEVKSGNSQLNAQEKRLKEAIEKKRVEWEEFRIDEIINPEIADDETVEEKIRNELKNVTDDLRK